MQLNLIQRIFFTSCLSFLISGCVSMPNDADRENGYTRVQAVQYKKTIGYTNPQKREKDLIACGVRKEDFNRFGLGIYIIDGPNTQQQLMDKQKRINSCIAEKGYIIFYPDMCTYDGEELGICN